MAAWLLTKPSARSAVQHHTERSPPTRHLPAARPSCLQLLIDGPVNLTGVKRQVINIKWVSLTDFVIKISLNARQASLTKAWTEAGIQEKWAASSWAKKAAAKKAKAALNDFGRFQAKVKQQALAKKVKAAVAKA